MIVVDASTLVAAAVPADNDAIWARRLLASDDLAAPHIAPCEAQQAVRRLVQQERLSTGLGNQARLDLAGLRLDLHPFGPFADRVWSLRENLTTYDAWYVALAEALEVPLATLDRRLATAPGIVCQVLIPGREGEFQQKRTEL